MRTFSLLFITLSILFSCTTPKTDNQQTEESTNTETAPTLEARLQGNWVNLEDSLYTIIFKQDQYFSTYAGQLDPSTPFKVVDTCPGITEPGEYIQLVSPAGAEMCYSVIKLTEEELDLIYLEKGNTLQFRKK